MDQVEMQEAIDTSSTPLTIMQQLGNTLTPPP
jgi:hypothetical protein